MRLSVHVYVANRFKMLNSSGLARCPLAGLPAKKYNQTFILVNGHNGINRINRLTCYISFHPKIIIVSACQKPAFYYKLFTLPSLF